MFHLRKTSRYLFLSSCRSSHTTAANDLLEAKRVREEVTASESRSSKKLTDTNTNDSMANSKPSGLPIIPSSGFTAFLRSISSGLPFFPKANTTATQIDFATTREFFIPVDSSNVSVINRSVFRFSIQMTRPTLIRLLATDSNLLEDEQDRQSFQQLCHGIDSAVTQRYQLILSELKQLFDPLNPDNETLENRRVGYRDRLDNEYWLLQKMDQLLHRANFTSLPSSLLLNKFLLQDDSLSPGNFQVRVDGYDYDVLKFWTHGREQIIGEKKSWLKRLVSRKSSSSSSTIDYFKRVIIAVRLKGQDRLYLKAFRDIPLHSLTKLLPCGKLQFGQLERKVLVSAALLGSATIATDLISTMADHPISGLFIGGTGLSFAMALWSFTNVYRSKIGFLSSANRILFYKNIASNKQLLAMMVDRAQDELAKEVLLVYMLIQSSQKHQSMLTIENLELEVENWIQKNTNSTVAFKSQQSIEFLRQIGIILPNDSSRPGCIHALPMNQVVTLLPKISRTLSEKQQEWDLIEGYDKKYFEIDWKTVLEEDQSLNKSGWH